MDRQTLLVNTTCSLKFLEEHTDRQAQIWKVLQKYHNLLDEIEDLHSHFDSFKSIIKTDFKHFKEATSHNVQNTQTSLAIPQIYSSTLCTHVNNIYNKLSELQKHIQHHCMYPHQTDTVQINAAEYDPDIDGDNQPNTDKKHATVSLQGPQTHLKSPPYQRMIIVLPLITLLPPKTNKKLIGLMLPLSRYQAFLQQHRISHQKLCIIDVKSSPLQWTLKYPS